MPLSRPLRTRALLLAASAALVASGVALAGQPHEHGVARLDIALDTAPGGAAAGVHATLALKMPLDSLVGFERAPRTDAERRSVAAAVAKLGESAALFRFDPAAACQPAGAAEMVSRSLNLGGAAAAAAAPQEGHDDLEASFDFRCARAPAFVDLGLVAAFPRVKRIEVQTATASAQARATLRAGATQRVALATGR